MTEKRNMLQAGGEQKVETAMKQAGLCFFVVMIMELPLSYFIVFVQNCMDARYHTLISILMTQGYLLIAALCYIGVNRIDGKRDLRLKRYKITSFFYSLLLLLAASPMASWLNLFSQLFVKNETGEAIYDVTQNVPVWLGILIIGCLPGVVEEMIYRGILYSAFRNRSVLTGVLVSGLSFGFMHMNFNQILYAVYLGIVFALVVEVTDSLLSSMLLHMVFNAINTLYLYLLPAMYECYGKFSTEYADLNIQEELSGTPDKGQVLRMLGMITPMAVIGMVLMVLILKKMAKINGREFSRRSICEKRNGEIVPLNIWLILGWLFCLLFASLNLFGG